MENMTRLLTELTIDENEIPNGVLHIIKAHWEQDGTYISVLDTLDTKTYS